MTFSRTRAKPASVGSKSTGSTLPAAMPSSTTSMKRTFGVRIENTWVRSTPGRKNVASVTLRNAAKKPGVNMSPSRAITAMSTRSAPPNSSRYWRKVSHVLVLDRHQLGEAGIDAQSGCEPCHRQGGEREYRQHDAATGEEQPFDAVRHGRIRGLSRATVARRTLRSGARRRPTASARPRSPRATEALATTRCARRPR